MIIVTGASGQLGHAIVERLLERVDAKDVGVSVRDPEKVRDLFDRGVRVRAGDFSDAKSLRSAFEGASQVLLVSSNVGAFGGDPVVQHKTAIAAAHEAGASRLVYTSHQAASLKSHFGPARDHAATEAFLATAQIPFVALRNGFYATTVSFLLGDAPSTGELTLPFGGKASWTAPSDLAEAAAIVLSSSNGEKMVGPITLTAAEAVGVDEMASLASEVGGREIKQITVSDEEYSRLAVTRGVPAARAKMVLSIFAAMRAGEFAVVDPTLEKLLGRKPLTLRSQLARKVSS